MKLKVILLEDLKGVGRKYEVKELASGYVRNFLLPKKLAELATPHNLRKLELKKQAEQAREEELANEMKRLASLENLVFYLKTGPRQEIYNSLSAEDIEKEIKKRGFPTVEVHLNRSIKELGEKEIEVSLGRNIRGKIKIVIQPSPK